MPAVGAQIHVDRDTVTYGKRVADRTVDSSGSPEGGHPPDTDGPPPPAAAVLYGPSEPSAPSADVTPVIRRLDAPADGVPPVIADLDELRRVADALAGGSGPVAVDVDSKISW